jgi:hypothetical protein
VFALIAAAPAAQADSEHFRGCLTGTKDNYLLRTDSGEVYRLRDHPEYDLRSHLGDTVDVKGHFKDGERERQAQAEPNAGLDVPKHAIDVSHIETLSHGCAEVKNGVAVIVPKNGAVVVAQGQPAASGTVVVAPGQTTTANTVVTPALPQSAVVVENGSPEQRFVGCLVGTDDFYVLKTDEGTLYRLRNDDDLSHHVGETIEVTGRIDNSKREVEAQNQADLASRLGVQIPQVGINVSTVKTLAKGCSVPQ